MATKRDQMREGDEIISSGAGKPTLFRRRVVRRIEVPVIRRVKVPVYATKVVTKPVTQTIKTKRMVEVPDFKEVQETYTRFEEQTKTREKKKWVQKPVMEEHVVKVPVTKTRMVRKPVTKIVNVEEFKMVQVPGTKLVQVEGFRIDTVESRKMVEDESWELLELRPHRTGERMRGEETVGEEVVAAKTIHGDQLYTKETMAEAPHDWDNIPVGQADENVSSVPLYGSARIEVVEQQQAEEPKKSRRRRKAGGNADSSSV